MAVPQSDPIVVAPTPTPFNADDSVDHDALARNIERWLDTPLSGFVLGTANGEELALSECEKVEIVRTVHAAHGGRRFVIAGTDSPSATQTIRQAERFADAGADLIRVRIPRDFQPSAIEGYFDQVTERSPRPVVVIHQTFTGIPAAPPEVIGAVCQLDNVFGYITDHNIRFEANVRPHVPSDRRFWICNGGLLLYGTLMGANGASMWLGNVAPSLCVNIVQAGHEERFSEARSLQAKASRLDHEISQYGVAGVKAALGLLGFEGTLPRAPRPPVSDAPRSRIESVLNATGLL